MVLTGKTRERLIELLKGVSYRTIISKRLGVHPNTVGNVLLREHDNLEVATELLVLGQEQMESQTKHLKKAKSIARQLSA